MAALPQDHERSRPPSWWREPEILGLILLVAAAYFFRAGAAPLRGEETRWALVAQHMAKTGDWIVPHQQDEPFLNRPPLHCWLIAATGLLRGQWDVLTFRLPSLLATLLLTVLVYGYARVLLSRLGAFAAAAALVTMAELLQTCRLAETDAIFIPLVAASLLVWHWGYSQRWPAAYMWVGGYSFMALAALTKGPQAPIYFAGSIGVYLFLMEEWRRVFTWAHLLGISVAALMIGAWFVPLALTLGWAEASIIWTGQTALRMQSWTIAEVAQHMAQFPVEVLGCTMPWSLLLAAYLHRSFRTTLGTARPAVAFLSVCLAVAFPTCWIPPGARSRYLAPLYPCLAVLVGLVIQRCAEGELVQGLRRWWKGYVSIVTAFMVLGGFTLVGSAVVGRASPLGSIPLPTAVTYAGGAMILACLAIQACRTPSAMQVRLAVIAIASFMGLIVTNVVTDFYLRSSPDLAADIAEVQKRLPPDAAIVSLDPIHHRFAFFFGKSIGHMSWPKFEHELPENLDYFCFDVPPATREAVPFPWEEVAIVSMERKRRDEPREVVIVGRRSREVRAGNSGDPRVRVGLMSR